MYRKIANFVNMETITIASTYKNWVIKNPKNVAEMESIIKWGSYFLVGRFQNSALLSEVVYSTSRLFEMFNDYIIKYKQLPQLSFIQKQKFEVMLTILEYVEVLIEVGAGQLWGEAGRWGVVAIIQLIKALWRSILFFQHKVELVFTPPIKPVDRKLHLMPNKEERFRTLPHSGRKIRQLEGAPPVHMRTFAPLPKNESNLNGRKVFSLHHLTAEALHIFRPLCHLSSLYAFGQKSWVPWVFSMGLDVTSLHLHETVPLSKEERLEIARRRIALIYYLVRNPMFQVVTHKRIQYFLRVFGKKIPLMGGLCDTLMEYIPEWQKLYSYTWS